jgi:predicted GNAT family acetyltransferase
LRTFARLLASNWQPPSKSVEAFYAAAEPCVLGEDARLRFYLGYIGSEPVATAELTLSDAVAGLYNIATLEPYRRQGIGAAMTFRPLLDALAVGYRTAVLQAAPAGVNVYARLGFREIGR